MNPGLRNTDMCFRCAFCYPQGLDSASALEFVSALRLSCQYLGRTNFASLYQASEAVYEKFDTVVLIAGGRCIFCGPTDKAKEYFENMGFECAFRTTTPDFLTGVSVESERKIKQGYEDKVPNTPEEFEKVWLASPECAEMMARKRLYDADSKAMAEDYAAAYGLWKEASGKTKLTAMYPTTLAEQLNACLIREAQLLWGGRSEVIFRTVFNIAMALIVGSVYFQLPFTGSGGERGVRAEGGRYKSCTPSAGTSAWSEE